MSTGAWYEVRMGPGGLPFVVGEMEAEHYRSGEVAQVRPLVYAPIVLPIDVDALAKVIHSEDDWDELHIDDKEFPIESAKAVLAKFRVYPKYTE